jgi:hypothetical protein
MKNNTHRLFVKGEDGKRNVPIYLSRDSDERRRYRWLEAGTGADTEVSAPTVAEAYRHAYMAWPEALAYPEED